MATETIDQVAAAAWARTHRPTRYISAADTAKLVRAALKRDFPGVKFSIRSKTYSGGASIDVKWIDGPRTRDVEAVAKQYAGGRFDGMIDLAYGVSHFLTADGRVMLANNPGTAGSRGTDPGEDNRDLALVIPADAELVHFHADYVFCERMVSDETAKRADALAWIRAHCTLENNGQQFGNRWIDDIANAMARDYLPGEDWESTFQRFCNPYS